MTQISNHGHDYDHWSADYVDVTELQSGYETVFAARHRDNDTFVTLVPVVAETRGALDASHSEGRAYRRVVRPRQGAPADDEHTTTFANATKQTALDKTHDWLENHPGGLSGINHGVTSNDA